MEPTSRAALNAAEICALHSILTDAIAMGNWFLDDPDSSDWAQLGGVARIQDRQEKMLRQTLPHTCIRTPEMRKPTRLGHGYNTKLSTWRLVPLNLDHALWAASSVHEQVYLRARNATEARLAAARQFATSADVRFPGATTSPWLDRSLVVCVRVRSDASSGINLPGIIDISSGKCTVIRFGAKET